MPAKIAGSNHQPDDGLADVRCDIDRPQLCGDPVLDDGSLRSALEQHWAYSGKDEDRAHEIYHDDAVIEFPQSRERFEGAANVLAWRKRYPAEVDFRIRRISHRDDLVVTEYNISYDGGPWMFCVSIMQFRGQKVEHEHIYIMEGWQAPEWRVPWRAGDPSCEALDG